MLIGLLSDTHDRAPTIDDAFECFKYRGVTMVVHCGDWKSVGALTHIAMRASGLSLPVKGVLGNNDTDTAGLMQYAKTAPGNLTLTEGILEFTADTKRVAAYHGHHKPTLKKVLLDDSYDIVLLGHSHKPKIDSVNGTLIVNPGSTAFSIPRSRNWQPSVALIDTKKLSAEIVYL